MVKSRMRMRPRFLTCEELPDRAVANATQPVELTSTSTIDTPPVTEPQFHTMTGSRSFTESHLQAGFTIKEITLAVPTIATHNVVVSLIQSDGSHETRPFEYSGSIAFSKFSDDVHVDTLAYHAVLRVSEVEGVGVTHIDYPIFVTMTELPQPLDNSNSGGSDFNPGTPPSLTPDYSESAGQIRSSGVYLQLPGALAQLGLLASAPVELSIGPARVTSTRLTLSPLPPPIPVVPVTPTIPLPSQQPDDGLFNPGAVIGPLPAPTTSKGTGANLQPPSNGNLDGRGVTKPTPHLTFNAVLLASEQHDYRSHAGSSVGTQQTTLVQSVERSTNSGPQWVRITDDRSTQTERVPFLHSGRNFADIMIEYQSWRSNVSHTDTPPSVRVASSARDANTTVNRSVTNFDWMIHDLQANAETPERPLDVANAVIDRLANLPLGEAPFPDTAPIETEPQRSRFASWFAMLAFTTLSWSVWRRTPARESKPYTNPTSFGCFE